MSSWSPHHSLSLCLPDNLSEPTIHQCIHPSVHLSVCGRDCGLTSAPTLADSSAADALSSSAASTSALPACRPHAHPSNSRSVHPPVHVPLALHDRHSRLGSQQIVSGIKSSNHHFYDQQSRIQRPRTGVTANGNQGQFCVGNPICLHAVRRAENVW